MFYDLKNQKGGFMKIFHHIENIYQKIRKNASFYITMLSSILPIPIGIFLHNSIVSIFPEYNTENFRLLCLVFAFFVSCILGIFTAQYIEKKMENS